MTVTRPHLALLGLADCHWQKMGELTAKRFGEHWLACAAWALPHTVCLATGRVWTVKPS